ncbi:MAG: uracil-DNA glycosylase [Chloroflexota bacterium]|nr:uracil-DNA glycosylase [Chloroflexota bacterium]
MAESGKGLAAMKELEAQVKTCQLCRLSKTRTNAVPGEGYIRTEVMLIGEGPGYHEDKQGRPFIGPAGQFLNELLAIAGLARDRVYITNVVKCRPPGNRDPQRDEIAACGPYLERQISGIRPKVIVTLGRYSMQRFFPGERISQIHGSARVVDGILCVAMYHPAAGLHQASLADVIRADFGKLPVYLEQAASLSAPPVVIEERVEEAYKAREEVVALPQTSVVLEEGVGYPTTEHGTGTTPTVDVEPLSEDAPSAPKTAPKARAARKSAGAVDEYKQMSLFDI